MGVGSSSTQTPWCGCCAGFVAATTRVRREAGLKLPDAIIAATALTHNAMLVTADGDFARVAGLRVSSLP